MVEQEATQLRIALIFGFYACAGHWPWVLVPDYIDLLISQTKAIYLDINASTCTKFSASRSTPYRRSFPWPSCPLTISFPRSLFRQRPCDLRCFLAFENRLIFTLLNPCWIQCSSYFTNHQMPCLSACTLIFERS